MAVYINSLEQIKTRLGINVDGPVQAFMTETCFKAMDKYVPRRDGNLKNRVWLTNHSITYQSPYARYQYYGVRADGTHKVKHYTTPGTGPYWDQRMLSAEKDKVIKEVQDFFNKGGH